MSDDNKKSFAVKVFDKLNRKKCFWWISDEKLLKIAYRLKMGRKLDLENPKAYTEKLQWLKLYDRNPYYTKLVDKYEAKKIVADKLGEEYIIPTLGVWDKFDDIDFDELPDQFVLKCTHDSGGLVICKDKSKLDKEAARKKIEKSLERNYYIPLREWPYKNVPRKIIAEKYMVDESGTELKDYKFFCFNGEVKALFIGSNRGVDTRFDFYDENFNHLPIYNGHKMADKNFTKPEGFEEMKKLASILSAGMSEARIDFYNINGQIYFGEITFFHNSGLVKIEPEEWDYRFGSWIQLPKNKTVEK